jgi:hypothetical protein
LFLVMLILSMPIMAQAADPRPVGTTTPKK